jgi:hypothetical protein
LTKPDTGTLDHLEDDGCGTMIRIELLADLHLRERIPGAVELPEYGFAGAVEP